LDQFVTNYRKKSWLKFAIAALIMTPVCFIVAHLLRKIPGVARVL
jgi:hypothetical protein